MKLSLTFDNGPTPGITDRVLDTLNDYNIPATFFLVGTQLQKPGAREIAERAAAAGHRLGNHSLSHGTPLGQREDPASAVAEIIDMFALMGDLADPELLFRPNARGKLGNHVLSTAAVDCLQSLKASVVLWNSVPRDRKVVVPLPNVWLEDAKKAVASNDWTLMVLHDRPSGFDDPTPMDYLSDFLSWAVNEGVEFRRNFPRDCTPLVRGKAGERLADFVAKSPD